jgi:hypothetical protein
MKIRLFKGDTKDAMCKDPEYLETIEMAMPPMKGESFIFNSHIYSITDVTYGFEYTKDGTPGEVDADVILISK